ncbi:DUF1810 family protein [Bradyrhizobium sp. LTSP849]|uniref:DUF1810 family protein n=1 Tax=Bradyrhizobium sp. LTSP849 TaxID=1615890 RepID=UPI001FDA43E9|nr:DUF1810 family protein [Bradyrhizobium sp. LTSP849]
MRAHWPAAARRKRVGSNRSYPRPRRQLPAPAQRRPETAKLSRPARYGGATTASRLLRCRKPSDPQIDPGGTHPHPETLYQLPHWEPKVRHNRGRRGTPRWPKTGPFDLNWPVHAQNPVYRDVQGELPEAGSKGHWMWFIFPQGRGPRPQRHVRAQCGSTPARRRRPTSPAPCSAHDCRCHQRKPALNTGCLLSAQIIFLPRQLPDRS